MSEQRSSNSGESATATEGKDTTKIDIGTEDQRKTVHLNRCKVTFPTGCFEGSSREVSLYTSKPMSGQYLPVTLQLNCHFIGNATRNLEGELQTICVAQPRKTVKIYKCQDNEFTEVGILDSDTTKKRFAFSSTCEVYYCIEEKDMDKVCFTLHGKVYANMKGEFKAVLWSAIARPADEDTSTQNQILELAPVKTKLGDNLQLTAQSNFGTTKGDLALPIDNSFLLNGEKVHDFHLESDYGFRRQFKLRYDILNGEFIYAHHFDYHWSNPGIEYDEDPSEWAFKGNAWIQDFTGYLLGRGTYCDPFRPIQSTGNSNVFNGGFLHATRNEELIAVKFTTSETSVITNSERCNIHHDNIVRWIASGKHQSLCFVAMELCICNLKVLRGKYLNGTTRFWKTVLLHIATGLHYIHEKNLPHKKLSEDNILLCSDGKRMKISIFSESSTDSARNIEEEDMEALKSITIQITRMRGWQSSEYSDITQKFRSEMPTHIDEFMKHPFFWNDDLFPEFYNYIKKLLSSTKRCPHHRTFNTRLIHRVDTVRELRNCFMHFDDNFDRQADRRKYIDKLTAARNDSTPGYAWHSFNTKAEMWQFFSKANVYQDVFWDVHAILKTFINSYQHQTHNCKETIEAIKSRYFSFPPKEFLPEMPPVSDLTNNST